MKRASFWWRKMCLDLASQANAYVQVSSAVARAAAWRLSLGVKCETLTSSAADVLVILFSSSLHL